MATRGESVDLVEKGTVTNLARAGLFAALVGAFAYVAIPTPFSPAPVTLQVLGVFLAGILLGPAWGGFSLVLYLSAGALGAPVFAGGTAGIGVLVGETAGYLWSYPIAAFVVGTIVHRGTELRPPKEASVGLLVGAMVVGVVVIYGIGTVVMAAVLGLSLLEAFLLGTAAFVPFEAAKIAAAVGIVHSDRLAAV